APARAADRPMRQPAPGTPPAAAHARRAGRGTCAWRPRASLMRGRPAVVPGAETVRFFEHPCLPVPHEASIPGTHNLSTVMPGLGPGIHELRRKMLTRKRGGAETLSPPRLRAPKLVDARAKAWHDER